MAGWSSLAFHNLGKTNLIRSALASSKNALSPTHLNYVPVRSSGHVHSFLVRTSQFRFTKIRDLAHFYFALGALPLGALILYCNIFIGPAKLAAIPEGYVPKHWEYYEHPITRWFAKKLPSPQECYELYMHRVYVEGLKYHMRLLEQKIQQLMKEREDYQAWYYVDPGVKHMRKIREMNQEVVDSQSKQFGLVS